ncbi:MAG: tRNA dihydrouridine synthase DusB [Oscillospiraceae bacterium]|nr:tRNA dihydrouridine synthase DusB [Oscillospiraceae bacterium]
MQTVTIAGITVERTAALAPMAGVADTPYRTLCKRMGAVMTTSEMISAKGLCYDSRGSAALCRITPEERPMALQLFGNEPDFIARAARMVQEYKPDLIDLNMGCPVQKVTAQGAGSALMKTPDLAAACVRAAVAASDVPVTVKMRIGWDEQSRNAVPFALAMEEAGAAALTVHGRTRSQLYSGKADWEAIAAVKAAVRIPVIGSGDVTDAASCEAMYRETGADLVCIGRASYGNPWIFSEIGAHLRGEDWRAPTPDERMEMMLLHIRMILQHSDKPPALAIREARKHASWYMTGGRGAAAFRARCYTLSSYEEAERLAEDFLLVNREPQQN